MLKNIKIIFIDIDGTLSNDNGEFTEFSKNIIKKTVEQGKYVVLCSGRANSDVIQKSNTINASSVVISSNGTMIFDYKQNKKIFESKINPNAVKEFWNLTKYDNVNVTLNSTFNRFKSRNSTKDGKIIQTLDEIDDNITQIVIDTKSDKVVENIKTIVSKYKNLEIKNLINQILNDPKIYEPGFELDISNKNSNKGVAINLLLQYLNFSKENSICFGDSMNDYQMFESSGFSVAMENASKELKAKANYVTFSNNDDGVARFIEKYII